MIWDANTASGNKINNRNYYQYAHDLLLGPPATTTTTATATTSATPSPTCGVTYTG